MVKLRLSNVSTVHVKRVAKELIRRFPNRFSNDFEHNKEIVALLVQGATTKIRNQIAGYITHLFAMTATTSTSNENLEEG